jgi:hypothetical protein
MPNLLHVAILVDRAQWLEGIGLFTSARDHYLLVAEIARESRIFWLEDLQLQAAADCQARAEIV